MDRPIRILHADDDPDLADLTADFLRREDDRFEIYGAVNAADALEKLAADEYDCVVSDYDMPGDSGIEFLESVREDYPDLPFILFTGKGSEEVASEAISAGVTDYLQKETGAEQYELLANRIATAVDQYRIERELERQNALFAKAQDIARVGAWEYDIQNGDSYVTDELLEIHGLDPGESLTPEQSLQFHHPDDRPTIREAFERATEDGESFDLVVRLIEQDGRKHWVRTRGEPQRENGEIVRVRGTLQDITEQRCREMELERQNERLEEFAHVVSHDVRNPLQVAAGNLAQAEETGDEAAFRRIERAHDRIDAIIDDVLTLSRLGQAIGETEPVDLGTVARDAWSTVDTDGLTLDVVAAAELDADPDRLRQLFENLFRNSVEHGSTGPDAQARQDSVEHAGDATAVTVGPIEPILTTTRATSDSPNGFYVADDGPGVPEDIREDVFTSGFSTSDEGTGFGLAIVAQIADAHGWSVTVCDSHRGGARFEFVDRLARNTT